MGGLRNASCAHSVAGRHHPERITAVEETSKLETQSAGLERGQQLLQRELQQSSGVHAPLLASLDFQVQWANEVRACVRAFVSTELMTTRSATY